MMRPEANTTEHTTESATSDVGLFSNFFFTSAQRLCCFQDSDSDTYLLGRSHSPTAASFLRATQPWDESRTFLQALREKYISPQDANNAEIVYISGKHAEEVGLEKLAKRQALLQGIHTLVLDRMCIRYSAGEGDGEDEKIIEGLCKDVTSLDVGGNLFESWEEVLGLCRLFPKLRSLTLDGNRVGEIEGVEQGTRFSNIRYLGLTDTLLRPGEIVEATKSFPNLETLILASNELEGWNTDNDSDTQSTTIHSIDLSGNQITTLDSLSSLFTLPHLHTLLLKANKIGSQPQAPQPLPQSPPFSTTLQTLDLRSNSIADWSLPSSLTGTFPSLSNLLIASNPLYASLKSADDKPLTPSDGYTLTLARLPQLHTLNYSTITDKERLNAETYYLGQIARELAKTPPQQHAKVLSLHPRWGALCEEYGEPVVPSARAEGEVDPASLAARLVSVTFHLSSSAAQTLVCEKEWTQDIPRSASVYALLGRVGKKLGVMPLRIRLVWQTGERDPVRRGGDGNEAPECWDSSEDEGESGEGEWTAREVELVPGTRMAGSYFEGVKAKVRVEVR